MELQVGDLTLVNFRSYAEGRFSFGPRSVLVGPNAAGKTNLLEALYLFAATKSFRADRELEMIRWGESQAGLRAGFRAEGTKHDVLAQLAAGTRTVQKTFKVDGTKTKARDLLRRFPMTLFSADDVRLIDGAPGRRRRAMDLAIGQSDAAYHEANTRYGRVVASRNRLLEQIQSGEATESEIDFWDEQLIEAGQTVIDGRVRFAEFLNERLTDIYQELAHAKPLLAPVRLELAYEPLSKNLAEDVPRRRAQDLAIGTTGLGPHRDDWKLVLGKRPISSFGSGGEYRSAMLALRMAEAAWLEEQLGVTPILLLDDVFSELDEFRREGLLANLPGGQVIITTPEAGVLPKKFAAEATITDIKPQESHA